MSRLTVATPSDVQEITRNQLGKGALKSGFLPGPTHSMVKAGYQPSGSGLHYHRGTPILVQFPAEVLGLVLGYLQPIWLLQVELAYSEVGSHLKSSLSNNIWYEAIPPALYTEPDTFQDEEKVAHSQQRREYEGVLKPGPQSWPSPTYIHGGLITFGKAEAKVFVSLPGLDRFSHIHNQVNRSSEITHPKLPQSYPYIFSQHRETRVRNLAIGGPFQPALKYRRELLGHLHLDKRCSICFELLTSTTSFRPPTIDWDMKWCSSCLDEWTVSVEKVDSVPGLRALIKNSMNKNNIKKFVLGGRFRSSGQTQWLPLVDEILRAKTGIDFETTVAKQSYIKQILDTVKVKYNPIDMNRIRLRQKIIAKAQELWDQGLKDTKFEMTVEIARNTFAPTAKLAAFLFAPQKLTDVRHYEPCDQSALWPEDPTMLLRSSVAVISCTDEWVSKAAKAMIVKMLKTPTVTAWVEAADAYHVRRLKGRFTADAVLAELRQLSVLRVTLANSQNPYSTDNTPALLRRPQIILDKLHLHDTERPELPVLTVTQKEVAKAHFEKILFASCVTCPQTFQLALPRGIEGVVTHFRECHPERYWREADWLLAG